MNATSSAAPVCCFPPIAGADARVLILGTMPGQASLAAGQYYAHPRNAFWPIMGDLLGFSAQAGYAQRCQALRHRRVALWDVLASCHRRGSLDSNIRSDSLEVNDFAGFLARHPNVTAVCFNGGPAEQLFRRHVIRAGADLPPLQYLRLPSTSPAHAARRFQQKLEAWRVLLELL